MQNILEKTEEKHKYNRLEGKYRETNAMSWALATSVATKVLLVALSIFYLWQINFYTYGLQLSVFFNVVEAL